ncbi:mitochondrial thioredoxin [Coemansia sp. BCRC 34301]|nr:mitochondrial thioredoxin [Coemansia sp. BCRC 34301]
MPVVRTKDLDELRMLIRSNDKVVAYFYFEWSRNCQAVEPKFDKLVDEYDDIVFIYVNIANQEAIIKKYGITVIPTFKFFEHSVEVGQLAEANDCALEEGIKLLASS